MEILLDTHIILWLMNNDFRLSSNVIRNNKEYLAEEIAKSLRANLFQDLKKELKCVLEKY